MGLSQGSHRERPISASISRHTIWRRSLSESWSADCANSPANVGTLGRGGSVAARSHLRTPSRSLVLACVDSQCRRGEPRDNSASGQTMLTLKLIVAAARCDIASIRLSRTHRPPFARITRDLKNSSESTQRDSLTFPRRNHQRCHLYHLPVASPSSARHLYF